ncbi:MAG: hypothetical protein PHI97_00480 [Desulfobulbus sp.]|jgi:hypothetical protein|nr:hypothetical protein [Desulfobulbus sp.]
MKNKMMNELEIEIADLEEKQRSEGLSQEEKSRLYDLQNEWFEVEASRRGGRCLSCFM